MAPGSHKLEKGGEGRGLVVFNLAAQYNTVSYGSAGNVVGVVTDVAALVVARISLCRAAALDHSIANLVDRAKGSKNATTLHKNGD